MLLGILIIDAKERYMDGKCSSVGKKPQTPFAMLWLIHRRL